MILNKSLKKDKIYTTIIAEIRHNITGEIRKYESNEILYDGAKFPPVFNWEENNYSCDCNRHMFFKLVNNEEIEEDDEIECSNGKYSVNLRDKLTNEIYYSEY